MKVVHTFRDARRHRSGRLALVPTMGYLHEGHLSCVATAADHSDQVVLSLFVNPLQFDKAADLERYPRDLERDVAMAEAGGVDIVFAPPVEEMYPDGSPLTTVRVAVVAEGMEGDRRPGHFDGVATVVSKLFAGIQPDVAAFGRKDAQQLAVVRRMARDLSFPVEVVGISTMRHADGLALSSRNVFIEDRPAALSLSRGLFAAADLVASGERAAPVLEATVAAHLDDAGASAEYVTLADADTAQPMETLDRPGFLAVAATVGSLRLIDNVFVFPDGTADRGTMLNGPSILGGD